MRRAWSILTQTIQGFIDDNVFRLSAALAFYTAVSLAPTLLLALAIAGPIWGAEATQSQLVAELSRYFGPDGAKAIQSILTSASRPKGRGTAAVIGILTLGIAATAVFAELHASLNTIWGVPRAPRRRALGFIRRRFVALVMLLSAGALVLASLVATAWINIAVSEMRTHFPEATSILPTVNLVISIAVFTIVFTLILTLIPDTKVPWRYGLASGFLTALLFAIGKELIGWYLSRAGVSSTYGAAGSLVVILLWVYYSSLILFLGAEFSKALTRTR